MRFEPTLTEQEYAQIASSATPIRKARALSAAAVRAVRTRGTGTDELLLVHRLRFLAPLPGFELSRVVDVYDFDDALFLGSILPTNRRFESIKREAARHRRYLKSARLVLAGNAFLAAHARELAQRVEVVPSCVDPQAYEARNHAAREVVTVGWIGSSSTSPHLMRLLPIFARLNADGMRVRLLVIGADVPTTAEWLEVRPWSEATQARDLAEFDIGVMPMPDTPWTRGKCGYKLLQYFASGIPAVASPVGVNIRLIGEDRGRLAGTDDDWLRALHELTEDVEARRSMGAAGRDLVEREYSYGVWAPELASMFREL